MSGLFLFKWLSKLVVWNSVGDMAELEAACGVGVLEVLTVIAAAALRPALR